MRPKQEMVETIKEADITGAIKVEMLADIKIEAIKMADIKIKGMVEAIKANREGMTTRNLFSKKIRFKDTNIHMIIIIIRIKEMK